MLDALYSSVKIIPPMGLFEGGFVCEKWRKKYGII
jgi:hypothetical protein